MRRVADRVEDGKRWRTSSTHRGYRTIVWYWAEGLYAEPAKAICWDTACRCLPSDSDDRPKLAQGRMVSLYRDIYGNETKIHSWQCFVHSCRSHPPNPLILARNNEITAGTLVTLSASNVLIMRERWFIRIVFRIPFRLLSRYIWALLIASKWQWVFLYL